MCKQKEFVSKRQEEYFLNILPKLDKEIVGMDLGMRANTCLVNAGVLTVESLKQALLEDKHIPYLDKFSKEEIIEKLKI